MSYLTGLEEDLVLGGLKLYREFDVSHFVSNAKSAISGKANEVKLSVKFNYYSNMLEKAIESFSNIPVSNDIKDKYSSLSDLSGLGDANLSMRDVSSADVISIRPQYIGQYTALVGEAIDKVIKGVSGDVTDFVSGELVSKVKKQCVKTTLPYYSSAKDLLKINSERMVPVTGSYITKTVTTYVSNIESLKKDAITEATATLNAIKEAENTIEGMLNVINKKRISDELSPEVKNQLNKLSYNTVRGIIDIISYVSFMTIRKLNIISSNLMACDSTYRDISNLDAGVEESAMDTLIPRDTNSVAEEFITGNIGAYEDLANNIYEFHSSIPHAEVADMLDQSNDELKTSEIDQQDFDSKVYKEAYKIFDSVNGGLDTIAAASDEYLMVFDDIVKEAGFELRLEDRYRTYIEGLDDLSIYRGSSVDSSYGTPDKVMYKRILLEVKQFPSLVKNVAEICQETKQKADMLIKRFNGNINGEFKDAESVNEIKVFLSDLVDQYNVLTRLVCGKLMHRLIELGNILTEIESNDTTDTIVPDVTPIDTSSNVDFSEGMISDIAEEYEEETLDILNHLEMQLYAESYRQRTGKEVIFEAPDPNSPTAVPAQTPQQTSNPQTPQPSTTNATGNNVQTTGQANTTVTVQDNDVQPNAQNNQADNNANQNNQQQPTQSSTPTPTTGTGTDNAPKNIGDKYVGAADRFLKSMSRKTGGSIQAPVTESVNVTEANNADWLAKNEDELTSRVYSNVSVQRIDSDITNEKRIQDLEKIAANIDMLAQNPGELQSIKSEEDAARKVAPMVSSLNTNDDIKKQMRNYYRTGSTSDPQPSSIANSELKNHVNNKMIPRVKAFHDRNAQGLADAAKKIGESMNKLKQAIGGNTTTTVQQNGNPVSTTTTPTTGAVPVAASADFSYMGYSIFEDDNTANPQQTDPNANANTKTNLNQVVRMIDKIAGAAESQALNAAYDEYNDDMKAMNALVPKVHGVKETNAANANPAPPANPQPVTPVTASVNTPFIVNGETYTAESYLDKLLVDIGLARNVYGKFIS